MTGAGLPVPPGFALTTEAFRTCRDAADLDKSLARLLFGLDVADLGAHAVPVALEPHDRRHSAASPRKHADIESRSQGDATRKPSRGKARRPTMRDTAC